MGKSETEIRLIDFEFIFDGIAMLLATFLRQLIFCTGSKWIIGQEEPSHLWQSDKIQFMS